MRKSSGNSLNVYMDVSCCEGVSIGAYVFGEGFPIVRPVKGVSISDTGTTAEIAFMIQIIEFLPFCLPVTLHHDQKQLEGMLDSKSKRWRPLRKALYDRPLVTLEYSERAYRSELYHRCHVAAKKAAIEQSAIEWDAKLPRRYWIGTK